MKNKMLNIIGIITVVIAIFFGWRYKKMELGKFNLSALDNAVENVNNAVGIAREKTEQLVAMPDKTYMNFVRALSDSDAELDAITAPIFHLDSVNNSPQTTKITTAMIPVLSDYASDMSRHRGIYDGILEIKKREYDKLNIAQKRVIDDAIKSFKLSGIDLPSEQQSRLKEISAKLSQLGNDFGTNIIAANKKNKIKITDEKILGDMPQSDKDANKTNDGWEFSLLAPSYIPFMEYVTERNLREQMYKNYVSRAPENEKIINETLLLKDEYSQILGFENYAELAMQFRDAKTPARALEYLNKIATAANDAAHMEFATLKNFSGIDLHPWDTAFYSRLLKREKYDLDESITKPYFELNNTTNNAMDVVAEMFDIKFVARDAQKWHTDVKYFNVIKDKKVIGGLYLDLQTRESKKSGAWMNDFSNHYRDAGNIEHLPTAIVVANFTNGTPALLSLNDISTLFHEMGHAMHVLLSTVDEEDLSGASVYWDVVEFPSQFLEKFWNNPTVLKRIGKHYQTGEIIPDELIQKIIASDRFQRAMFVVRQLEFGLFDLQLYTSHNPNVQQILDNVRDQVSVMIPPKYNKWQNTFSHIFGGGYAAGYYSYMWAENMAADAYLAVDKNPFNHELMHRYRDTVLANGGACDMSDLYIGFIGREPYPDSLLKFYELK